jgi:hypothetical protein
LEALAFRFSRVEPRSVISVNFNSMWSIVNVFYHR